MERKEEIQLNEKMQQMNNIPLKVSLNGQSFPTGNINPEEKKWNEFKDLVEKNIKARLENIILRMYKWKLPEDLNERVIEYGFLTRGWVTIFNDPKLGTLGLGSLPAYYNVYGEPTVQMCYGFNDYVRPVKIKYKKGVELPSVIDGYTIEKSDREGITARDNNYGRMNMPKKYIDYIEEYTQILTDLKLAMYVSAQRLKQPFIIAVKKKALGKSANKLIKSIKNNNISVLIIDGGKNIEDNHSIKDFIDVIDLKGDNESPKKLAELWENQFNMFLSTIGINTNPSPDKAEVVLNSELNSNNNLIDIAQDIRFLNRQELCKRAKDILGIEMSVEKNIDEMSSMVKEMKEYGSNETNGFESNKKNPE